MDYTQAPDSVTHVGTGHKMHTDTAAVTTMVTASDLNMVIWELMEILGDAGTSGAQFNPADPNTYRKVVTALYKLFLTNKVNSWGVDSDGNQRVYFETTGDGPGSAYIRGHGAGNLLVVMDHDGNGMLSVNAGGKVSVYTDAISGNHLPRLSQVNTLIANAVGIGSVAFFARTSAPSGYLKANGAAVSRTTYAALFDAISTTFGAGDGSTTFNLPDLRGEFIRGLDDGRNVDAVRTLGSWQDQQLASHYHQVLPYDAENSVGGLAAGGGATYSNVNTYGASLAGGVSGSVGNENRPRNVALLACIKY